MRFKTKVHIIAVLALLSLETGCQKTIKCNVDGTIVNQPGDSDDEKLDHLQANTDLAMRRLDDADGQHRQPDYLRGTLAKAQGCP